MVQETSHPRPGTRKEALWRHADFMKLWIGETVSLLGSEVTALALPLTAILLLKATPFQMGVLNATTFAPFLVIPLFAGLLVDHTSRRRLLIIANLGRAALLGLIPLLALLGQLHIEYLFLITLSVGVLGVFFKLAYEAYLPHLISSEELLDGNSKLSLSGSFAELAGPGLAGALVQLITAPLAILVDAASFLFSSLTLLLIRQPEPISLPAKGSLRIFHSIGEGLRLTGKDRYLRAFAGEAGTHNLFWQMMQVILILYAIRQLHFSSLFIGFIFAIGSTGALLSALFTQRLSAKLGVGRTMIGAQLISDLATLLIPLTALIGSTSGSVTCILLAFFFRGIGNTICNVQVSSVRQIMIPDHLRGRINAVYSLLVSGAVALGALLGGVLGEQLGMPQTLLIGAIGILLSWLWLLLSPLSLLKRFSDIESIRE